MPETKHPWSILIDLVNNDPPILTADEARSVVLAHQEANRRALMEIHALLPELMHRDLIAEEGANKIRQVVTKAARDGMPDL
jgi:hypothetical protein